MKITWLIPTTGLTGGIKVIFEHANYLSRRGHQVTLVYPYIVTLDASRREIVFGYLKMFRRFFICLFSGPGVKWFKLESNIKLKRVKNLAPSRIPDGDIVLASSNETADWLNILPASKGEKFYFIQDYEIWSREPAKVDATWKMPFKKIVISSWLKNLAREKFQAEVAGVVFDGLDLGIFQARPIPESLAGQTGQENQTPALKVLMLYHPTPKKGFSDGLAAFKIAQDKFPHLELIIFGAYRPGPEVPKTARFYYHPTGKKLGALYQEADIFLWPSRLEGFGLPPLEAMASGAAVVMTNTGAASDYAINNENALIVPPGDINALSAALITLITQPEKRISLARAGEIKAREFSQEKSDRQLEKIILQV